MLKPMTRVKIVSDPLNLGLPLGKEAYIVAVNPNLYTAYRYLIRVPATKLDYSVPAESVVPLRDDETSTDYSKLVDDVLVDVNLASRNWEMLRSIAKQKEDQNLDACQ